MIRSSRSTPRRRGAPKWTALEWVDATNALLARCKGLCEICGNPLRGRAERSHRVRRRDGGDRLSNLLLVHPECHQRCHHEPLWAVEAGWQLYSQDDPLVQPVFYQGKVWKLLDDDGGLLEPPPPI